ncbi:VanZ family protein [Actinacidiphila glaucinigra]|uniref:VanZ family protein n=1 Tax=Actinacidiphila glaucinigra TaxID=235986 RepID=UPI003D8F539D
MISASIDAISGVVIVFLVLAALFAFPTAFLARRKNASTTKSIAAAVFFAGAFAVTLTPGSVGDAATNLTCITGTSLREALETTPGKLNLLLFLPAALFLVISTRQPMISLAVISATVPSVELAQAALPLGRTCTYSDIALNCIGAALGFITGLIVLWREAEASPFSRRDIRLGGFAVGSALTVSLLFYSAVTPVEGASEALGVTADQDHWARDVAAGVFGAHAKVVQVQLRPALPSEPVTIDVTTGQGVVNLSWTSRKILAAEAYNHQDDGGTLNSAEAKAVGERFATRWFPEETKGSEVTWDLLGEGKGPYSLSYRRYRDDVLMPMRLDITVTSSGRIMAITVRSIKDPLLPKPVLKGGEARHLAEALTKMDAIGDPFLLAEKVNGVWRPLWLINVGEKGEAQDAPRIDAITGQRVQPEIAMGQDSR